MSGILPLLPKTIDDEQPTRWSGTTTHPYGDVTASKVFAQYEFTAVWSSSLVVKGITADTGLKLLAAAMRSRWRARGCLEKILMIVWNVFGFPGKKIYDLMSRSAFITFWWLPPYLPFLTAQRGISISVYHGKWNEFNRVVCVGMKTVLVKKNQGYHTMVVEQIAILTFGSGSRV